MIDDIREKFMPRFRAIAEERLQRLGALEVTPALAASELHALAGEASILGLPELASLARAAERRWRDGSWAAGDEWPAALAGIQRAIREA